MGKNSKKSKPIAHMPEGIYQLLQSLFKLQSSSFFREPVNVDLFKCYSYYEIVKNPMDLSKIKKKLIEGEYSSIEEFQSDIKLIGSNCILYNPNPDHYIRKSLEKFEECFDHRWGKLMEAKEKSPPEFSIPLNCEEALSFYKSCEEKTERIKSSNNSIKLSISAINPSEFSEKSDNQSSIQMKKVKEVPQSRPPELEKSVIDNWYKVKFHFYDIENDIVGQTDKQLMQYNSKIRRFLSKMSEIFKIWPRYTPVSEELTQECHKLSIDDRYRGPESNLLLLKTLIFIENYEDLEYDKSKSLKQKLYTNSKRLYKNLKRRKNYIEEEWEVENYEEDLKAFSENLKKVKLEVYTREDESDKKSRDSFKRNSLAHQRSISYFPERHASTILKIEKNTSSSNDPRFIKEIIELNSKIDKVEYAFDVNEKTLETKMIEMKNNGSEEFPSKTKLEFGSFALSKKEDKREIKVSKVFQEEDSDNNETMEEEFPFQEIKKSEVFTSTKVDKAEFQENYFQNGRIYKSFTSTFSFNLQISSITSIKWEELSLINFFEKYSPEKKSNLMKFREANKESGVEIKVTLRDNLLASLNEELREILSKEIKFHCLSKVRITVEGPESDFSFPHNLQIKNDIAISAIEEFLNLKEKRFECESKLHNPHSWHKPKMLELKMTKFRFYDELINSFLQISKLKRNDECGIYYEIEKKESKEGKAKYSIGIWTPFEDITKFGIFFRNNSLSKLN